MPTDATPPVLELSNAPAPFAPPASATITLPDGRTLVPESRPATAPASSTTPAIETLSVADAVRAHREAQAKASETPAATTGSEGDEGGEVEPPPVEGETAPEGEGSDGAEGEDGGEGAEGEGAEGDPQLRIELENPVPNQPPIILHAPDAETAAALQRLQNGYMRGETARVAQAEARQVVDEFEEFRQSLQLDPISVIESALTVDQGVLLARSLLANPAVYEAVLEDVQAIADGDEERIGRMRDRLRGDRAELRDRARADLEAASAIRQNARDINAVLGRIIPADWSDDQRDFFLRDARGDLQAWQQANKSQTVPPRLVAQILAPRLRMLGIDPTKAPPAAPPAKKPASSPARVAPPAAAAAPAGTTPPGRTPEQARRLERQRQLVAAPAQGAVASGRPNPLSNIPKDADVKTAIQSFRALRRASA